MIHGIWWGDDGIDRVARPTPAESHRMARQSIWVAKTTIVRDAGTDLSAASVEILRGCPVAGRLLELTGNSGELLGDSGIPLCALNSPENPMKTEPDSFQSHQPVREREDHSSWNAIGDCGRDGHCRQHPENRDRLVSDAQAMRGKRDRRPGSWIRDGSDGRNQRPLDA